MTQRVGRSLALVVVLLGTLVLAGGAPAQAQAGEQSDGVVLQTTLTGLREIRPDGSRGAGDPEGVGAATVTVRGTSLCFMANVAGIELPAAAAHIHEAAVGGNGPIAVPLPPPDADGRSGGCVPDVAADLLGRMVAEPQGFYVNIHTEAFPMGAVRGQLQRAGAEGALFGTVLSGAAEVGPDGQLGTGDMDGSGVATAAVNPRRGRVCFEIWVGGVQLPTAAAHIHRAPADANGPIVVPLEPPDAKGISHGCVRRLDPTLLRSIAADPDGFYVNVHTAEHPAGAVRGQLVPGGELAGSGESVYGPGERWLCRADLPAEANACRNDLDVTTVAPDGTLTVVPYQPAPEPAFDCFYVYPTVRLGTEGNAAFDGDYTAEIHTTRNQAAHFSRHCEVYAPLYRQRTLGAPGDSGIDHGAVAYADVLAAFRYYLDHHSEGRPFVLMGHSQGAGHLRRLIAEQVDPEPALRSRLISALLLGTTVDVPDEGDVGGSFPHVPACRSQDQVGCVVSYASFRDTVPPPPDSFFGRAREEGNEALCVNPAGPGGGEAGLEPYFDVRDPSQFGPPFDPWAEDVPNPPAITTPFVALPGLVTADCVEDGPFSYLELSVQPDPGPRVDDVRGDLTPQWGMHLIDANVAMGNLLSLVARQAEAWFADPVGEASGSFSALTYNVAGLPQGINADQFPEQHIPIISPLLNAYDVAVFQEDFAYTDLLRAGADHEFKTEPHPGPGSLNPIARETALVGDGLNVFSRYRLGELERVPWNECGDASGDCLSLKGFAATTLELEDDVSVGLYSLHLDAGGADSAVRGSNLDQLASHLEDHATGAVILGGDWNLNYSDDPDGDQLRGFLERTGLQDVCDVLDCGADDDVIDRFFFRSGEDVTLTPTRHRFERDTFVNGSGEPLSDHDPLAVEWDWTAIG